MKHFHFLLIALSALLMVSCESDYIDDIPDEVEISEPEQLMITGIDNTTDILAKYNIVDFSWSASAIGDAIKQFDLLLDDQDLPSTTENHLRLDLDEGEYCLKVKAVSADTTLYKDSDWGQINFNIDKSQVRGCKFNFEILWLRYEGPHCSLSYKIIPENTNVTYDYGIIKKEIFDGYDVYVDGIRSFVQIQCIEPMLKFHERIFVWKHGELYQDFLGGFDPNTEYILYAYGLKEDSNSRYGKVTTSFQYLPFTTPGPDDI